jgi:hypothetical protein
LFPFPNVHGILFWQQLLQKDRGLTACGFPKVLKDSVGRLAQSVDDPGSNPGRGERFRTRPDRPRGPPSLLYNGYQVFRGGKAAGAWCWPPTLS